MAWGTFSPPEACDEGDGDSIAGVDMPFAFNFERDELALTYDTTSVDVSAAFHFEEGQPDVQSYLPAYSDVDNTNSWNGSLSLSALLASEAQEIDRHTDNGHLLQAEPMYDFMIEPATNDWANHIYGGSCGIPPPPQHAPTLVSSPPQWEDPSQLSLPTLLGSCQNFVKQRELQHMPYTPPQMPSALPPAMPEPREMPPPPLHADSQLASLPCLLGRCISASQPPAVNLHARQQISEEGQVFPQNSAEAKVAASIAAASRPSEVLARRQANQQPSEIIQPVVEEANSERPVTTLMIRNLPPHITQVCLIKELNKNGFEGTYDFVYMPQCFHTSQNTGFAFINFINPCMAGSLVGLWHRQRRFDTSVHLPPLNIAAADVQGLEANMQKWITPRLRRIKNPNFRPFVLKENMLETLPGDFSGALQ